MNREKLCCLFFVYCCLSIILEFGENEIMKIKKSNEKKCWKAKRKRGEVGFECDRCGRVVDVCIE